MQKQISEVFLFLLSVFTILLIELFLDLMFAICCSKGHGVDGGDDDDDDDCDGDGDADDDSVKEKGTEQNGTEQEE